MQQNRRRRSQKRRAEMPDILYHATNTGRLERYRKSGALEAGPNRSVFLSLDESAAWEVAHRSNARPEVLYVDAGRAWRSGVRFHRTHSGLWAAPRIPIRHVLNLRDHFREQVSAGGFLVRRDRGGVEIALVSCTRRSGTTWEIAKGKLEAGETPPQAAMRELQEEMGFEGELEIGHDMGVVRYGFQTPEGHPRLKSMHVYLIETQDPPEVFQPADGEGIGDVRWFRVPEAARVVRHTSLKPLMRELLRLFPDERERDAG
ncbi:MAG: NUDIX domain-containing protein [Proteobacteria bacterium]|nr:NUDIX domain-containing protein [Pseudomonadota bacterium]